jgi:hypothetical protein
MKYLIIVSLFFVVGTVFSGRIKTVAVELIEEEYNGKQFAYRIDVVNGVKKEQWTMAGKSTDYETYESEILFEKLQEEKNKREKAYQVRLADLEFKEQQRLAVFKKILKKDIDGVQQKFDLFQKYDLNEYYAFDATSIASEIDFLNIPIQCIIPAKNYLQQSDNDFECEKAEEYIETLQAYFKKISTLFDDTIKKAIDQCEDTQKLKDLLVIVS